MACQRCGCRMVSKAKVASLSLICVDCGTPVLDARSFRGQRNWMGRIGVVTLLLVLAGLPAMLGNNVHSNQGSSPAGGEPAGGE